MRAASVRGTRRAGDCDRGRRRAGPSRSRREPRRHDPPPRPTQLPSSAPRHRRPAAGTGPVARLDRCRALRPVPRRPAGPPRGPRESRPLHPGETPRRPPRGSPPRHRPGRPRAALDEEASTRLHPSSHAGGRKPGPGDLRIPAACARMRVAGRSSVQPTAGVAGSEPMSGGSDGHRWVPASPSDPPARGGTVGSPTVSSASISRRSRARARCATLRYFSGEKP